MNKLLAVTPATPTYDCLAAQIGRDAVDALIDIGVLHRYFRLPVEDYLYYVDLKFSDREQPVYREHWTQHVGPDASGIFFFQTYYEECIYHVDGFIAYDPSGRY
jgi:hypothetical protein